MQAVEELNDEQSRAALEIWLQARDSAIGYAQKLGELGVHKQIVNRILEPWMVTKVVATATDWDNFFFLRNHKDAQPEIQELARKMLAEYKEITPKLLLEGEWHLPYIHTSIENGIISYSSDGELLDLETAKKVSGSMCAQVSYRKSDTSIEKACAIYDRLVGSVPKHSSPFEHQATPASKADFISGNLRGWIQLRQTFSDHVCTDYFSASDSSF
jgi:hypothetical protein